MLIKKSFFIYTPIYRYAFCFYIYTHMCVHTHITWSHVGSCYFFQNKNGYGSEQITLSGKSKGSQSRPIQLIGSELMTLSSVGFQFPQLFRHDGSFQVFVSWLGDPHSFFVRKRSLLQFGQIPLSQSLQLWDKISTNTFHLAIGLGWEIHHWMCASWDWTS